MSGFWFGIILGVAITVFVYSLSNENGFARQLLKWVGDKINGVKPL